MFTPDSYNNDPAKIMRAELRAAQAEAREARMARAQSQSRSEAFTLPSVRRRAIRAQPLGRVRRRASRILFTMAEALIGPAERERDRKQCRAESRIRFRPNAATRVDTVVPPCPGIMGSLRLVQHASHAQDSLFVAHLVAGHSGGSYSHGRSRCPHQ